MNRTPIEWCDFTVNPFRFRNLETGKVGHFCDKISPGCANCYSSEMQKGPYLSGLVFITSNKPKGEFFLDENVLHQVLSRRKSCVIFWCDMTDMFLHDYPDEWIDKCFAVMALTPHLTHLVLTKRADRMREYFADAALKNRIDDETHEYLDQHEELSTYVEPFPLPNVRLSVSIENQEYADRRFSVICDLGERGWNTMVSLEPLLGPVAIPDRYLALGSKAWPIIGGESGPGARPCDLAWIRSLGEQCEAAGVAPFVKQLGAHAITDSSGMTAHLNDRKGGDMSEWPKDVRVRRTPAGLTLMPKPIKKKKGATA